MNTDIYEIVLTDIAKEELEEIYSYIEKYLLMSNTANRLMKQIEENILILERNPYLYKEIRVKPHNDIYRVLYGKRDYLIVEDEAE